MANINKETISQLKKLSRIDLCESEQETLLDDLQRILHYVDKLQKIDTEGVKPCNSVHEDLCNVMREDEVQASFSKEQFLMNVPEVVDGMVKVPPVVEKGRK